VYSLNDADWAKSIQTHWTSAKCFPRSGSHGRKAVAHRLTDVAVEFVFALADSRFRKEGLKERVLLQKDAAKGRLLAQRASLTLTRTGSSCCE
jgi:hypothetical protein